MSALIAITLLAAPEDWVCIDSITIERIHGFRDSVWAPGYILYRDTLWFAYTGIKNGSKKAYLWAIPNIFSENPQLRRIDSIDVAHMPYWGFPVLFSFSVEEGTGKLVLYMATESVPGNPNYHEIDKTYPNFSHGFNLSSVVSVAAWQDSVSPTRYRTLLGMAPIRDSFNIPRSLICLFDDHYKVNSEWRDTLFFGIFNTHWPPDSIFFGAGRLSFTPGSPYYRTGCVPAAAEVYETPQGGRYRRLHIFIHEFYYIRRDWNIDKDSIGYSKWQLMPSSTPSARIMGATYGFRENGYGDQPIASWEGLIDSRRTDSICPPQGYIFISEPCMWRKPTLNDSVIIKVLLAKEGSDSIYWLYTYGDAYGNQNVVIVGVDSFYNPIPGGTGYYARLLFRNFGRADSTNAVVILFQNSKTEYLCSSEKVAFIVRKPGNTNIEDKPQDEVYLNSSAYDLLGRKNTKGGKVILWKGKAFLLTPYIEKKLEAIR